MKHRQPWLVLCLIVAGVLAFVLGTGRFLQSALPAEQTTLPAITALPNQIDGWWESATDVIVSREYHFSTIDGQLQAPNRAHGFRSYVSDSGLRFVGREQADWSLSMDYAFSDVKVDSAQATLSAPAGELVTENDLLGLKQQWSVASASQLQWNLAFDGAMPRLSNDAHRLLVVSPAGDALLTLDLLDVSANGQTIAANFVLDGHILSIETAASGPIVATLNAQNRPVPEGLDVTPSWNPEGGVDDARLGFSLNAAGDINDDGYVDVIMGAPFYDAGVNSSGAVFIYHNSEFGLPLFPTMVISGSEVFGLRGYSVATAGDVNNDGYDDIMIGAPEETNLDVERVGAAYVYLGSSTGISLTSEMRWLGPSVGAQLGFSVASAGDVNNDGFDDVLVGSPGTNENTIAEGSVHLYMGSISGTSTVAAWSYHCQQLGCDLGVAVNSAGNVNGDDYDDIVVGAARYDSNHTYPGGAYDEGAALVFHGSMTGPGSAPDIVLQPGIEGSNTGWSVAGIGDVNNDGYDDLGVGAPGAELITGTAYVYHGSNSSVGMVPDWSVTGVLTSSSLGFAVAPAGDIDGDGYDDLIIGDNQINGPEGLGTAMVYRGTPFSLETEPAWQVVGEGAGFWFGAAVAGAMDINNDGYDDVLVGSPNWGLNAYPPPRSAGEGNDRGAAYLYYGGPVDPITGLVLTHTFPTWRDVPITFDAVISTGQSVTYTWNLGDGTILEIYTPTVTHTYDTVGWYTVTITATNKVSTMSATQVLSVTKTYWNYLPIVVND